MEDTWSEMNGGLVAFLENCFQKIDDAVVLLMQTEGEVWQKTVRWALHVYVFVLQIYVQ